MDDVQIKIDGLVACIIKFEPHESLVNFEAIRFDTWDEQENPLGGEKLMSGGIKWDGCMNIDFIGSHHFCGKREFDLVKFVVDAAYEAVKVKLGIEE